MEEIFCGQTFALVIGILMCSVAFVRYLCALKSPESKETNIESREPTIQIDPAKALASQVRPILIHF